MDIEKLKGKYINLRRETSYHYWVTYSDKATHRTKFYVDEHGDIYSVKRVLGLTFKKDTGANILYSEFHIFPNSKITELLILIKKKNRIVLVNNKSRTHWELSEDIKMNEFFYVDTENIRDISWLLWLVDRKEDGIEYTSCIIDNINDISIYNEISKTIHKSINKYIAVSTKLGIIKGGSMVIRRNRKDIKEHKIGLLHNINSMIYGGIDNV